jgi:hypothetical protein
LFRRYGQDTYYPILFAPEAEGPSRHGFPYHGLLDRSCVNLSHSYCLPRRIAFFISSFHEDPLPAVPALFSLCLVYWRYSRVMAALYFPPFFPILPTTAQLRIFPLSEGIRCHRKIRVVDFSRREKSRGWPLGCNNFIFSGFYEEMDFSVPQRRWLQRYQELNPFLKKAPEGGRLSNRHKEEWQWQKEQ